MIKGSARKGVEECIFMLTNSYNPSPDHQSELWRSNVNLVLPTKVFLGHAKVSVAVSEGLYTPGSRS